ncbi:MAG: hypothetical protein EPO22_00160 [Dehalococcoidia bacterium]|nr:MAG: hypothetical protein EPO22_00160 [Dehalococcoidia bacterium]
MWRLSCLSASFVVVLAGILLAGSQSSSAAGKKGRVGLVSVSSTELQANGASAYPSVSANGRYVAFQSWATDLVADDTKTCGPYNDPCPDVFVHDTLRGSTELASRATSGVAGNHASRGPSISADGRYIAFYSFASNLVSGDTNEATDVLVRDRLLGTTERVSVASDGIQANGASSDAHISADGHYVSFVSYASNLVPGDDNGKLDVFVHDRVTGATERVSVAADGTQFQQASGAPSISGDGRFVAFASPLPSDLGGPGGIFVRDRLDHTTLSIAITPDGHPSNGRSMSPSISADGRYVAFESWATNLVPGDTNVCLVNIFSPGGGGTVSLPCSDIFVRDLAMGTTERVSVDSAGGQADGDSMEPSISPDGRFVAFTSSAANLVFADTNEASDVFVHDRLSGATIRASVDGQGTQGSGDSTSPALASHGRYVVFQSNAPNLVTGDSNGTWDVFESRLPFPARQGQP